MAAFIPHVTFARSSFLSSSPWTTSTRPKESITTPHMSLYPYSPQVDEYFAKSVMKKCIQKACPTGVAPIQCIEGTTFYEPYEARTLKRQSQLRYRQMSKGSKLKAMYINRQRAIIIANGCSHEESQIVNNPMMARALIMGKYESERACSRYITPKNKVDACLARSSFNYFGRMISGRGTFSTATTNGQAKYEAYLSSVRAGSVEFRKKQYSTAQKLAANYASIKAVMSRKTICLFKTSVYTPYPAYSASMITPYTGFYIPFVPSPTGGKISTMPGVGMDPARLAALNAIAKKGVAIGKMTV